MSMFLSTSTTNLPSGWTLTNTFFLSMGFTTYNRWQNFWRSGTDQCIWSPRRHSCTAPGDAAAPREAFALWRSARSSGPATSIVWKFSPKFSPKEEWQTNKTGDLESAHILAFVRHSQEQLLDLGVVHIQNSRWHKQTSDSGTSQLKTNLGDVIGAQTIPGRGSSSINLNSHFHLKYSFHLQSCKSFDNITYLHFWSSGVSWIRRHLLSFFSAKRTSRLSWGAASQETATRWLQPVNIPSDNFQLSTYASLKS